MVAAGISDYLVHVVYCCQGIVICTANGLLLLAILLEQSLRNRKEMLIIAGMAATDLIYGLGTMLFPIYRFFILARGEQNDRISMWGCISLPPVFIINMGVQLTSVMGVLLSVDRLMAVASPTTYYLLSSRYAKKILLLVAAFGVTSLTAMLLSTYFGTPPEATITKMCSQSAFSFSYNIYQTTLTAGAGYTSMAMYIGIFFAYRRAQRQIASSTVNHDPQAMDMQRRLTVTLGIITISTFFLFIIPFTILAICAWTNVVPPQSVLLGMLSRFSTIANVGIYVFRQKEIRKGMWSVVTCKKMRAKKTNTAQSTVRF